MMPTKLGMKICKGLRPDRLIHEGGHRAYNEYVKKNLNQIQSYEEFCKFHNFLKRNCRDNIDKIPW